MTDTNPRPMLAHAHEAADAMLARRVADGSLSPDAALDMRALGFTTATRIISGLRVKDGMSEQAITDAFQARLDAAEDAGDPQRAIAAEFALAVWDGMRRDLAAYLSGTGTEQR